MPIDINTLREDRGGDPEVVKDNQRKRFKENADALVDNVLEFDQHWRELTTCIRDKRAEVNHLQKQVIAPLRRNKTPCNAEVAQAEKLKEAIQHLEVELVQCDQARERALLLLGNTVDETVPVSTDEDHDNEVVRVWPLPEGCILPCRIAELTCPLPDFKPLTHDELLWRIGGFDPERGTKVAGQRGYFLRDGGVLLNQALIAFATDFLQKRGYSPIQVPFFMKKDLMAGIAQLSDFDEQLYKVSTGHAGTADDPGDKYLIATSEQPLCAFHAKEVLDERDLPLRYCGVSTCFRKEVGKANVDNRGIFRVHQFEKIEQFCITVGCVRDSQQMHQEMLRCAEEFHQALGLAYRVVNIVSGKLNDAAIMKYDLEGWFPGQGKYRELVSCSNCTDFQSRAMDIRQRTHEAKEVKECNKGKTSETRLSHVHMLNSTLTATGRGICCILETYQTPTGVHVPEALVPFMNGTTFLPFKREGRLLPKEAQMKVAAARPTDEQVKVNATGAQPADLHNDGALKEFDARLLDLPYMGGFVPTAQDRDAFETMDAAVLDDYPNLRRWYIQIASFSAGERMGWP
mmetsp:Transcript_45537/g.90224  ORF Transcript_45537/g.90224 Transcript_45537/m.90224 type:complete len:573 (+) Transcript_45537:44-1762(+)